VLGRLNPAFGAARGSARFLSLAALAPRGLTRPAPDGAWLRRRDHAAAHQGAVHVSSHLSRAVQLVADVRPSLEAIRKRDRNLHNQMLRASESMVLNLGEGAYSQGGNKRVRYFNSLGSTREVLSCLEVAAALGYVEPVSSALVDRFNHVIGTLVRLVKR
jgi:four helix bundle protein